MNRYSLRAKKCLILTRTKNKLNVIKLKIYSFFLHFIRFIDKTIYEWNKIRFFSFFILVCVHHLQNTRKKMKFSEIFYIYMNNVYQVQKHTRTKRVHCIFICRIKKSIDMHFVLLLTLPHEKSIFDSFFSTLSAFCLCYYSNLSALEWKSNVTQQWNKNGKT